MKRIKYRVSGTWKAGTAAVTGIITGHDNFKPLVGYLVSRFKDEFRDQSPKPTPKTITITITL